MEEMETTSLKHGESNVEIEDDDSSGEDENEQIIQDLIQQVGTVSCRVTTILYVVV